MKSILLLFLIAIQFFGYSQNEPALKITHPIDTFLVDIPLTKAIDSSNWGMWQNGDYKIFVELPALFQYLEYENQGLVDAMQKIEKNDSTTWNRYNLYIERYFKAIEQLRHAKNGFDLKQLVVYIGPENKERNNKPSEEIELYVRQLLEKGNVAVFYKEQRIFKLKRRVLHDYVMSTIQVYYDDEKNCAFNYIGHINW